MLQIHVIISLIAILFGLLVLYGLLSARLSSGWTAIFLVTTILTSLTGFPLAPFGFDPPRAVGVISLVLLAVAAAAYYAFQLAGAWRWIFVGAAVTALYLNVFVLIVQSFTKLSFLKALAPTQSELPFVATQVVALLAFVALGVWAARRLRRGYRGAAAKREARPVRHASAPPQSGAPSRREDGRWRDELEVYPGAPVMANWGLRQALL